MKEVSGKIAQLERLIQSQQKAIEKLTVEVEKANQSKFSDDTITDLSETVSSLGSSVTQSNKSWNITGTTDIIMSTTEGTTSAPVD